MSHSIDNSEIIQFVAGDADKQLYLDILANLKEDETGEFRAKLEVVSFESLEELLSEYRQMYDSLLTTPETLVKNPSPVDHSHEIPLE